VNAALLIGAILQIGAPAGGVPRDPGKTDVSVATFTRDVAPIVFEHCGACHRPGGQAPFSLLTYEAARPHAAEMAAATAARRMPPWKAEPGSGEFVGQRHLSPEQIEKIQRWVKDGAREGDPRHLPPTPAWPEGWQLGTPDLVLRPSETYRLPAEGADRYRVFVLTVPIEVARYVRGVEFRPEAPGVVHHANILIDRTRTSRERNEQDPALGESGLLAATAEYPPGQLLGWTPGQPDPLLPSGMAWPLAPGTDFVVQLHMVPNGTPQPVQFSVGLYLTSDPPTSTPAVLRLGRRDIEIPAGTRDYEIADSYVLPVDIEVRALKPHAHYRAREIRAAAVLPDGSSKDLIAISDWDFHWQHVYRYVAPVALPKGTTLTMRYRYDNSPDSRRVPGGSEGPVRWGPRSSDEMGDLWIQVAAHGSSELAALNADFQRKWLQDEVTGLESLIRRDPSNFGLRDEVALLYLRMGRWREAAANYEQTVRLRPDSETVHFNLATALMVGGRLEEAATRYREAIRLKPDYAAARSNLGSVLIRMGRVDDALAEYEAALRANPEHAGAHNNMGSLLMWRGDLEAAAVSLNEAIRLDSRLPDPHYNLGLILQARGDIPAALHQFQQALSLKPEWPEAMTALSWILATEPDERLRDVPRAVSLGERAVALSDSRSAEALDALAAAYAAASEFDRAVETIDKALRVGAGTSAEPTLLARKRLYQAHQPYRRGRGAADSGRIK
jgi:tetratricopeptide (TPR) repeat protein